MSDGADDLVPLQWVSTQMEAEMICSQLGAHGIAATYFGRVPPGAMVGRGVSAGAAVTVLVRASDLKDARALLP